jgi:hypothetical protein
MDTEEWSLMQEWSTYMEDFIPEDMVTFELASKKTVNAVEKIAEGEEESIRGAYFVKGDLKIDFYIVAPSGDVIFSRRNQHEGIFRFNTTMIGDYTFVSTSKQPKKNLDVTLALHTESLIEKKPFVNTDEMHTDLIQLESHIKGIWKGVKSF